MMEDWLEVTGAVGAWRCGGGDGPIDQIRVTFEVGYKMEDVFEYLSELTGASERCLECSLQKKNENGTADVLYAVKMPWPLKPREVLCQGLAKVGEQDAIVLGRSIEDTDEGLKESARLGRVRAQLNMGGYYLEQSGGDGEKTKVVYIAEGNMNGAMAVDWVNRHATGPQLWSIVEDLRALRREEEHEEHEEEEEREKDIEEGRGFFAADNRRQWVRNVEKKEENEEEEKEEKEERQKRSNSRNPVQSEINEEEIDSVAEEIQMSVGIPSKTEQETETGTETEK